MGGVRQLIRSNSRTFDRLAELRREIRSRTIADGVLGGNPWWLAAAALYWGVIAFRWAWKKEPPTVISEQIRPGESITITYGADLSRRAVRRNRRAGGAQATMAE